MKKLPVARHLTDSEYSILLQTYANHNSSMDFSERVKYTFSEIVKVERGQGCLHVHYQNGDWWHYTADGKWY